MRITLRSGTEKEVLPVADNYAIYADAMNVILCEKTIIEKGDNAGKEKWQEVGYYPTHKQALHDMVKVDMLNVNMDYQTIVDRIEYLHECINKLGNDYD